MQFNTVPELKCSYDAAQSAFVFSWNKELCQSCGIEWILIAELTAEGMVDIARLGFYSYLENNPKYRAMGTARQYKFLICSGNGQRPEVWTLNQWLSGLSADQVNLYMLCTFAGNCSMEWDLLPGNHPALFYLQVLSPVPLQAKQLKYSYQYCDITFEFEVLIPIEADNEVKIPLILPEGYDCFDVYSPDTGVTAGRRTANSEKTTEKKGFFRRLIDQMRN